MLDEIARRETSEGVMGFYPLCTTSINLTKRICDLLLLSKQRQPPLSPTELERVMTDANGEGLDMPRSNLWPFVTDAASMQSLHHYALADFHLSFMREKKTYLECNQLCDTILERLVGLSERCSSLGEMGRGYRRADPTLADLLGLQEEDTIGDGIAELDNELRHSLTLSRNEDGLSRCKSVAKKKKKKKKKPVDAFDKLMSTHLG